MRVLLVGMEWFPNRAGGLNRYFYEEAHALPAEGIESTVVVTALEPGQTAPFPLRTMGSSSTTGRARRQGVRQVVRQELQQGADVINAHFALYTSPWLRDLPSNLPLVCHFHGPWAHEMAAESSGLKDRVRVALARRIELAVYKRANRLITLSNAFADIAHTDYNVPRDRIRVVPGGINTSLYTHAPERRIAREQLGWSLDRPILLAVRRLARRMGLENLLETIRLVRQHHPDVLLLIGGRGALAQELEARIAQLSLQENVRLLGFIPDAQLPLAYAAADITVVPTLTLEGFGLITVESLSAGTPVLGTPIGGTPEILRGLSPDLIFEATTPEAMADRIQAAIAGTIALPDRSACRAYAARYDWATVVPQLKRVFEEACAETRLPVSERP